MKNTSKLSELFNRRKFIKLTGLGMGAGVFGLQQAGCTNQKKNAEPVIPGFEEVEVKFDPSEGWVPVSDRKIRVGLVGYGLCKFSAGFGFQNHPNVEVVAVSDLFPDRCAELAKETGCKKTYPSLEELVKDDNVEAVFVATDAKSHAKHCIEVLKHGKHVATAVPAVFGSLEEADQVFEAVKKSGLKYMMFETSCFHADNHAMRQIYNAGGLGKIIYSEGEYYHYMDEPIPSYKDWRVGLPPQWYPTHSNAYYVCVTGGSFTEVSCLGKTSVIAHLQPQNNVYKNPFSSEVALFRTSDGGMSRMAVCWDTPGFGAEGGRIRGERGAFYGGNMYGGAFDKDSYQGLEKKLPDLKRPPLPPGVPLGHHGGSHGYLMNDFVMSILKDRKPLVDIAMALNLTVPGIVAHQSAMKDGELLKIPQYQL